MLVIRRRTGEAIVLNDEIEIEVISISGTRVKLGVRAPREVLVVRREARLAAEENRRALDLLSEQGSSRVFDLVNLVRSISTAALKPGRNAADKPL